MLSKDGSVTALGWEPGGGVAAECEAGDPDFFKSIFFYDTASGDLLGTWVLPRPQSAQENCTVHNYNVIPTRHRDLLSVGAYQAGTYVVDFTDPQRPRTVAWHDPPALDPTALTLGGSWGSYWYNGFVYESDITKGLNVYRLEDRRVKAKADRLDSTPDADLGAGLAEEAALAVVAPYSRCQVFLTIRLLEDGCEFPCVALAPVRARLSRVARDARRPLRGVLRAP